MRCSYCGIDDDKVIDSRSTENGRVVRRRRHCQACEKRFTTYERIEEAVKMAVVKREGTRVPYDREKITAGLQRACWKRPISTAAIEKVCNEVEEEIFRQFEREVTSKFIGEEVARRLKQLDKVAYVRFASVYHAFENVGQFIDEARSVLEASRQETKGQGELFGETGNGE